jgi:hypothetical protein
MTAEIDSDALRAEIIAAYGVELPGELLRGGTSDAARVVLADRLASAIDAAAPSASSPREPRDVLASWTPLPAASETPDDPAAATERLLAWARAGGADLDALEIRTSPEGYRTAHARRDVAADARILYVPRSLFFELDHARRTPVGQTIAAQRAPLASEHTPLAVALLAERDDPTSRWRPFLDALPRRFPGMAVFQDQAALAPLVGSSAEGGVLGARRAVLDDHAALVEGLRPHVALTQVDLAWARAICASRVFATMIGGVAGSALIPIADTFDHGTGDVAWSYDDTVGGLVITAARNLAAGEEIHLSYGRKSNARLLCSYGFCVPDNPADVAQVIVPRPTQDLRGDLIARLFWDRPLGAPWAVPLSAHFDDDTALALSHARLAVATEREWMIALDRGYLRKRGIRWISERNEAAAWATLAMAANARLAALPAEPDPVTPYARAVQLLLRGERRVLEQLIQFVADVTPRLPGATRWDFRRMGNAAGDDLLGQYLRKVADELP